MSTLRPVVRRHLERRAFEEVFALAGERSLVRAVVSLLYDPEELLRWRAVSALGRLAVVLPDQLRLVVRRLLWTLNDESGGIGWTSAPALGEIGRHAPEVLGDAARIVAHYLEDPTLLPGVLWAIGRLAPAFPRETGEVAPELRGLLGAAEPLVRAQSARALGFAGDDADRGPLAALAGDAAGATIYVDDDLVTATVGQWAAAAGEALARNGRGT